MTQHLDKQTIGNTVYTVGQVLKNYTEAAPLLDYIDTNSSFQFYTTQHPMFRGVLRQLCELVPDWFPITITALPNPDPVEDEWRELGSHRSYKIKEAMANPYIRIDWPEWSAAYRKYGAYTELDKQTESRSDYCYECEKFLIRAVALGGKVSVKGGV